MLYVGNCKKCDHIIHAPTAKTIIEDLKRTTDSLGCIKATHLPEFKDLLQTHLEDCHNEVSNPFPSQTSLNDFREFFVISTYKDKEAILLALSMESPSKKFYNNFRHRKEKAETVVAK